VQKLISDHAAGAVKEREMNNYFNRTVAIDASMSLYQFLIAIRSGPEGEVLHNEAGEVTSHLQGMFYRTIRMLDNGIKPVFVFGQPAVTTQCRTRAMRQHDWTSVSPLSGPLSLCHVYNRWQGTQAEVRRSQLLNPHTYPVAVLSL